VKTFSLSGEGHTLLVNSADVSWGDTYLILRGSIRSETGEITVDGHVTADHLSWEVLKRNIMTGQQMSEPDKQEEEGTFRYLPITGRVNVYADAFSYGDYELRPFRAGIGIGRNNIRIEIGEGSACGIDVNGTISITPHSVSITIEPSAKDSDLQAVLGCFEETDSRITGHFDLTGQITAEGKSDSLLENMTGTLSFRSKDGRIFRMTLLSNILSIVNITEVFLGQVPDLGKKGMTYNEMLFRGHFEGSRFIIDEAALDGRSVTLAGKGYLDLATRRINMTVLVAPLKTIDRIIKFIPIIRDIFGGTLVSIPVEVEGNISDPDVTVLPPSAVGKGILNLFKNILELPFKIIEPIIPKGEDGE